MPDDRQQDKAAEALAHLQAAALELVAAARAALDVVEDAVSDPEKLAPLVSVVADVARRAGAAWPGGPAAPPRPDERGPDDPGVERIRVS